MANPGPVALSPCITTQASTGRAGLNSKDKLCSLKPFVLVTRGSNRHKTAIPNQMAL